MSKEQVDFFFNCSALAALPLFNLNSKAVVIEMALLYGSSLLI